MEKKVYKVSLAKDSLIIASVIILILYSLIGLPEFYQ